MFTFSAHISTSISNSKQPANNFQLRSQSRDKCPKKHKACLGSTLAKPRSSRPKNRKRCAEGVENREEAKMCTPSPRRGTIQSAPLPSRGGKNVHSPAKPRQAAPDALPTSPSRSLAKKKTRRENVETKLWKSRGRAGPELRQNENDMRSAD